MRACVPRCIEHPCFDGSADAQQHPGTETDIDPRDAAAGSGMRDHLRAGGRAHNFVANGMVAGGGSVEECLGGLTSRVRQRPQVGRVARTGG